MKTRKPLLFILLSFFSISAGYAQVVDWEMHHGQGMGIYNPPEGAPTVREILTQLYGNPIHGDPGGFQFADIPDLDDPDWGPAPFDPADGQLCFRLDRSELSTFMTQLDFTYFQTEIEVTDTSIPFNILYQQVDDGVRAYVFNSAHPEGAFIPGGDARLYVDSVVVDLSPLFVEGTNRIVLVQFDNAQTANYLKAIVSYGGDPCAEDETPPVFTSCPVSLTVSLDICYEFEVSPETLGITATDDCSEFVDLTLDQTLLSGVGTFTVLATATDSDGNAEDCQIEVTTEEAITVSAEDDRLSMTTGEVLEIDLEDDLLDNDAASDDSPLRVRNLALVNPTDGTLQNNGDGTFDFTPREDFIGEVQLTYQAFTQGRAVFFEENGHYYEYVAASGIPWEAARAAADAMSFNGFNGYLATITSRAENELVQSIIPGVSWLGASDRAENGIWNWVTGPEAGQQFWQGDADGVSVGGFYENWSNGQPDNQRNRDFYAQIGPNGRWNDWPEEIIFINGYLVEYGGLEGEEANCAPNFSNEAIVTIAVEPEACTLFIDGLDAIDSTCPNEPDGRVIVIPIGSDNEIEYSLDSINFQASSTFENLMSGNYSVYAREVDNPTCIASASFTLENAVDVIAPVIDATAIVYDTLSCVLPENAPDPDLSLVSVTDLCDGDPRLDFTIQLVPVNDTLRREGEDFDNPRGEGVGAVRALGTIVNYVFTGTDASGNSVTDTVAGHFLEKDTENPTFTGCPMEVVPLEVDAAGEIIPPTIDSLLGMDNCGSENLVLSGALDTLIPSFPSYVYTFTDAAGNTATCTFFVEIPVDACENDTVGPQIFGVRADGSEILLSEYQEERLSCGETPFVEFKVVDNCDPNARETAGTSSLGFDPFDGSTIIFASITARDTSGNETTEVYSYVQTTEDTTPPQIFFELEDGSRVAPADFFESSYSCDTEPDLPTVIREDECAEFAFGGQRKILGFSAGGLEADTVTYQIWATDPSENSDTVEVSYLIAPDTIAPQIFTRLENGDSVLLSTVLQDGAAYTCANLPQLDVFYRDNCDPIPIANAAGSLRRNFEAGIDTIIQNYTVTDASGNMTQESYTYTQPISCPPEGIIGTPEVQSFQVAVSPNPFRGAGRVSFTSPETGRVVLEVRNMNGTLIQSTTHDAVKGLNTDYYIEGGNLEPGIYMITLRSASAQKTIRAVVTQ